MEERFEVQRQGLHITKLWWRSVGTGSAYHASKQSQLLRLFMSRRGTCLPCISASKVGDGLDTDACFAPHPNMLPSPCDHRYWLSIAACSKSDCIRHQRKQGQEQHCLIQQSQDKRKQTLSTKTDDGHTSVHDHELQQTICLQLTPWVSSMVGLPQPVNSDCAITCDQTLQHRCSLCKHSHTVQ